MTECNHQGIPEINMETCDTGYAECRRCGMVARFVVFYDSWTDEQ